jgi:hypothetical protein
MRLWRKAKREGLIMPTRRGFLLGLGAALAVPAIISIENLMPLSVRRPVSELWVPPSWLDPSLGPIDLKEHGMPRVLFEGLAEADRNLFLNQFDYDIDYARDLATQIAGKDHDAT